MPSSPFFSLPLSKDSGNITFVGNAQDSALALSIADLAEQRKTFILCVVPDSQSALRLQQQIEQFSQHKVTFFSDWETLPYDHFSPHQDIISERLKTLYQLEQQTQGIMLVSASTLLQRLAPKSYLHKFGLVIKKEQHLSQQEMKRQLEEAGYMHVDQVLSHGEYASRGSLIDLFPMGSHEPLRIDFFDDEVDSLRIFDPETQRSDSEISEISLLPAHEFPTDDEGIETFRTNWRKHFDASTAPESIYQQISKKIWPAGIEYYLPLFFEKTQTLFDYLPENTLLAITQNVDTHLEAFLTDTEYRYDQRRSDKYRPPLTPKEIWLEKDALFSTFKNYHQIKFTQDAYEGGSKRHNLCVKPLPNIDVNHKLKEPLGALRQFYEGFDGNKVVFSVESNGRREALLDLLKPLKIHPKEAPSLSEALTHDAPFSLVIGASEKGFIYNAKQPTSGCDISFALICEGDLFGEQHVRQRNSQKKNKQVNSDVLVKSLAELQINQPVVHIDHGIGKYLGLQTLDVGDITAEYMTLEYKDGAKLYVPVTSLNLISRYSGANEETAPLHKLGGEAWSKARKKAAEKVRDVAAELLDIYAKRSIKPGQKFAFNKEPYYAFASNFPFEETPDQALAINSVISDMCQAKAMDRLVCGDVGFGKTEVAMRAAFIAIDNNRQVAMLVPTTLLAQQHYENFRDRFANLPVRIEVLSRFKTAKEQKQILTDAAEGKIDILIGTHKLLGSAINFYDLGLLIVDEEHRFGVRQKEKIKAMRADVDILTMTATPIPRTLNMSLSGMRDLSIIASPPAKRLSIKTFVRQKDDATIREAILREIMRGGQIYFLHNNVETINKVAQDLKELIPEARITVAHGQMRERELEKVMADFYHQRFNLLVCTTIIETGIDVPTANTIIMDRADRLGLAQLHQLRGRVGRSHHQAYAYLLTPHEKAMSKDAIKRLDAIASLEDLGAGFTLATHDLEIRGAGELLGDEQSGQIQSIGFTLYMEMLDQAVEALKEGKEPSLDDILREQTEVDLHIPALLPDDYIADINTRLTLYKQIASVTSVDDLQSIKVELIDRFGLLPDATQNLLESNKLKLKAFDLKVKKLEAGEKGGYIDFHPDADIDPLFMVQLLQSAPDKYRMDGPTKLKIIAPLVDRRERYKFMDTLLTRIKERI